MVREVEHVSSRFSAAVKEVKTEEAHEAQKSAMTLSLAESRENILVFQSASSEPLVKDVKLTATNVEMLRLEELESTNRAHTDIRRRVFDSMAANGRITLDQLPFVLVGAEVQATMKQIEDAIEEQLPDADDAGTQLDYQQVEGLYHQLNSAAENLETGGQVEPEEQNLSRTQKFRAWFSRRRKQQSVKATAFEKHMKPTTRLLLVILSTSCAISLAVVLLAIVFIWDHSAWMVHAHVLRDVELLQTALRLFGYTKPLQRTQLNNRRLATLIGGLVEELGFQSTKRTLGKELQYQESLLNGLLDGWFDHEANTRVATNAMLLKGWIQLQARQTDLADALKAVAEVNPTLPPGHELQLGGLDTITGQPMWITPKRKEP